jgi:hypothetical protein
MSMGDLSTFYSLPQSLSSEVYSFPCRGLSHLSIGCPQRRETKADTLKATEANRRRGPGTREKLDKKELT